MSDDADRADEVGAKRWDGPGLDAWRAWTPSDIARRLRDVSAPWCVVGGWAIDLFVCEQTRDHGDLEIAVLRHELGAVRAALGDLDLYAVDDGEVRALAPSEESTAPAQQRWALDPLANEWRVDVMLEPGDARTWVYRCDESLEAPRGLMVGRTDHGVPYLLPHGVLLFKARHARPKDEADFEVCLPRLSDESRDWLASSLARFHPGHAWLERLRGAA